MFEKVEYKMFRGTFETWDQLFAKAADFASTLSPEQLINISHSEDNNDGVVTVWFWSD